MLPFLSFAGYYPTMLAQRYSPRVLFVLKNRPTYGHDKQLPIQSSGLANSARFVVAMLNQQGYAADLVFVTDGNDIHREAVKFKADLVIIEAFWCPPYKFDDLFAAMPKCKFLIRNHSETPFLANEGMAFGWIVEYFKKPNTFISCNSPRMLEETRKIALSIGISEKEVDERVVYTPNYYPLPENCKRDPMPASDAINISCFGAIRPLKNQMLQAISAIAFADKIGKTLRFHINGSRVEMNGSPILKNLVQLFDGQPHHKLIDHGWLSHDDFVKIAGQMDICMQVSFSETFNIVAADHVTQGVPTVMSHEVPWASSILTADMNDSPSMVRVLERAWRLHRIAPWYNPHLKWLKRYDERSIKQWNRFLQWFGEHYQVGLPTE
jgi:hypothetical protein